MHYTYEFSARIIQKNRTPVTQVLERNFLVLLAASWLPAGLKSSHPFSRVRFMLTMLL
jgi:hypothetical protein